jgi:acrylyl-CoA reductase (NADPH)
VFKAIYLSRQSGGTKAELRRLDDSMLLAGDVEVRVSYSSINFKDALAITGRSAVVREWPMVAGIDLAGVIDRSDHPAWKRGEHVVVTGWGLGETHWGGLAQHARLSSGWLLRVPGGLSLRDSMIIGTAGLTAALCVIALRRHGVAPGDGEILVTGAAGGVGSVAIALLAGLGYEVTASTGRPGEAEYLRFLGATRIADRTALSAPGKPLQSARWAGVVDTVGSHTLANACASTRRNGAVTACGLAQGGDFPGTVMPFILRGVALYGINSVLVDNDTRAAAWGLLKRYVNAGRFAAMTVQIGLGDVIDHASQVLSGNVRGRTVVDVNR